MASLLVCHGTTVKGRITENAERNWEQPGLCFTFRPGLVGPVPTERDNRVCARGGEST